MSNKKYTFTWTNEPTISDDSVLLGWQLRNVNGMIWSGQLNLNTCKISNDGIVTMENTITIGEKCPIPRRGQSLMQYKFSRFINKLIKDSIKYYRNH